MATYYVSPEGSNTAPYDTWAKAANLPSTVISVGNAVAGPHIVYIAPGIYSDALVLTDSDWANGLIYGTAAHGSTFPASKGQVIITAKPGFHGVNSSQSGMTVKYLSVTGTDSTHDCLSSSGANFTGEGLYLYNSGRRLLSLAAAGFSINRSTIEGAVNDGVNLITAAAGSINYSLITQSTTASSGASYSIKNAGPGTVDINNCVVIGSTLHGIGNTSTGATNVNNCVVAGGWNTPGFALIRSAGTLNATTCVLIPSWKNSNPISGTVTESNNKKLGAKFKSHQRKGIIVPMVDDIYALSYAQALEQVLSARVLKGTFAIYAYGAAYGTDYLLDNLEAIQAIQDAGIMSLAVHSYSHSDMTASGNVFSIAKTGHTVNIDRAADTITVNGASPVTVSGFKSKMLYNIRAELTAGGCTCGAMVSTVNDTTLGESLADSSGAQASPYTAQLLIDTTGTTGYYKVEVGEAIARLESNITGYDAKLFVTPGGTNNTAINSAIKAYMTSGDLEGGRVHYAASGASRLLSNIDLSQQSYVSIADLVVDGNDDATKAAAHAVAEYVVDAGILLYIVGHDDTEATMTQWEIFFDVVKEYSNNLIVTNSETAMSIIKASPWTTLNGYIYTRAWEDSSDYMPTVGSPLIDAGTGIPGLTLDYAGNKLPISSFGFNPDIGAYDTFKGAAGTLITAVYTPYASTAITSGIDINICTASDNAGTSGYLQKLANVAGTIECPAMHDGTTKSVFNSSFDRDFNFYITQWSYDLGTMRSGKFNNATLQIEWGTSVAFDGQFPVDASNKLRVFYGGDKYPIKLGRLYMYDRVLTDREINTVISGSGITYDIQYIVDMQGSNVLDENGSYVIR